LEELERLSQQELPADMRADKKPTLKIKYNKFNLRLDSNLKSKDFESILLLAWHTDGSTDGNPIGKVLNFDDLSVNNLETDMIKPQLKCKDLFMRVLRDTWMNQDVGMLHLSDHIADKFRAVYKRALAPRLLTKLLDGEKRQIMCPFCGEMLPYLTFKEQVVGHTMYLLN
jgi:hypothetical protein